MEERGDEIVGFAEASDGEAQRLRGQLGLDVAELERWGSLSPGERKRWQVGTALHADPGILILDEPTNHLDVPSCEVLEQALRGYAGTLLFNSHDRSFINALATRVIDVRGGAAPGPGGFATGTLQGEAEHLYIAWPGT